MSILLPMRTTWPLFALLLLALPAGCASSQSCTEIGCDHEAVVTYPAGLVSGAYSLVLRGDTEMLTARCLDPGSEEAAENPEGLSCDASGFTLLGIDMANEREVVVTIIPDEGDEVSAEVRLEAIDEITPNGPDCPPVCFVRNGQVRLQGEP